MIDRFHLLLHFIPCLALKCAESGRFWQVFRLEAPGASWEMDKLSPMSWEKDLRVPEMRDTRDTPMVYFMENTILLKWMIARVTPMT